MTTTQQMTGSLLKQSSRRPSLVCSLLQFEQENTGQLGIACLYDFQCLERKEVMVRVEITPETKNNEVYETVVFSRDTKQNGKRIIYPSELQTAVSNLPTHSTNPTYTIRIGAFLNINNSEYLHEKQTHNFKENPSNLLFSNNFNWDEVCEGYIITQFTSISLS